MDYNCVMICPQVPAAVVNFKWDPTVMKDILAAQGEVEQNVFLKPELLQLVQELRWKMLVELRRELRATDVTNTQEMQGIYIKVTF